MILRYGQFANAVCDHTGKVIISTVYAKTVKLLGMDLLVYVLPEGKEEIALKYFSKEYGVFEYSHLERKTYIQSFAQKARLRQKNGVPSKRSHSTLYETQVIPYITKDMRILDFGAGQKDYATILKKKAISLTPLNSSTAKMERTSLMKGNQARLCFHMQDLVGLRAVRCGCVR